MMKLKKIGYKSRKSFIIEVIAEEIIAKQFKDAISDCYKLLESEKSTELKIILIRMLCEANYYERNFKTVKKLCNKLENEYSIDKELDRFIISYKNAISKEIEN